MLLCGAHIVGKEEAYEKPRVSPFVLIGHGAVLPGIYGLVMGPLVYRSVMESVEGCR